MKKKTASKKAAPTKTAAPPAIIGVKAFDANMRCLGFQFEVGKTYSVSGKIVPCQNGFHAIPDDQHPLSVLEYYPPSSRFCVVEQSGETAAHTNKLASASITIKAELSLGELIAKAVRWVFDRATPEGETATGVRGAASATGVRGAASATGVSGAASATGDRGAASATGVSGAASATGYRGAASATGDRGAASATGYSGAASATGRHCVALGSGGNSRAMATDGNALCLVNRADDGSIRHIRAAKCGDAGIEAGVWYRLNDAGEFERCKD